MAILATLICYAIIIPRILNVVRQKSNVVQIFADIPEMNIKEMLNSISEISIHDAAYDKQQYRKQDELSPEDKPVAINIKEEKKQATITHTKFTEDIMAPNLGTQNQPKPEDIQAQLEQQRLAKKRERLNESE